MAFTNRSASFAVRLFCRAIYFLTVTVLACVACTLPTPAQSVTGGSGQPEIQTVKKEGDNAEKKKTDRLVQIVIDATAERVRALVVAGETESGSTIEEASEYKILVSKPAGEDNGYGNEPKARYLSTFIIAEPEKGKTLVRLELVLVARTRIGTMRFDLNKSSDKKRAESEKVLQELKARAESQRQSEPSVKQPATPL